MTATTVARGSLGWAPCQHRTAPSAQRQPAAQSRSHRRRLGGAPGRPGRCPRRCWRPDRLGPRHRRRHRRLRGPGGRARPPGHRGRPQPRRPRDPRPAGRGARCRRPGHRPPGRPRQPARAGPRRTASTWCCATASSRWSTTRPRRWPRSPRCSVPAARSACWSASGTPPWSPGRWPATSTRPRSSSTTPRRGGSRPPVHRRGDHHACSTRPGFDTTALHAVRVFGDLVPSSLVDLEPGAADGAGRARAGGRRPTGVPPPRHPDPRPGHPPLTRPAPGASRSVPSGVPEVRR